MGYQLANQSSRHVYEDRQLVERVFDIHKLDEFLEFEDMTYSRYSTFCVRAVLVKILVINWTTWFLLMIALFISALMVDVAGGGAEVLSARPTDFKELNPNSNGGDPTDVHLVPNLGAPDNTLIAGINAELLLQLCRLTA
jgi:hypothetical protein